MTGVQMNERVHGVAVPALVVAAVLATVALSNPWGAGGFDDDWNYAWITREYAAHGRLERNGWAEAMVGAQAVAGAAAIRLFGDSAEVLRATVMLWHAGGVLALYALARRLGASRAMSAFVAAAYGVSPLAIPLAASYMTDVPGSTGALVTVLLGVVAFQRAGAGRSAWPALCGCAAAGYAAGTIRQVVWAVPVVLLTAFAWSQRSRRASAWAACLIAVGGAAAAWVTHRSFQATLESTQDAEAAAPALLANKRDTLLLVAKSALTLVLLVAPVAWAVRTSWGARLRRPRVVVLAGLFAAAGAALLVAPELAVPPWNGNTLNAWGVLGPDTCLGVRDELLPRWLRSAGLLVAVVPVVAWLAGRPRQESAAPATGSAGVLVALAAMSGLTLYRLAIGGKMPDRYLLPMLALTSALVVTNRSAAGLTRASAAGWAALAAFAAYGCATSHDYFELLRARRRALDEIVATGIDRTSVYAGYEIDGEYQLEVAGHIDGVVPAYTGPHGTCPPPSAAHARIWTLRLTPSIQPTHFVVTSTQDWLDPEPVLEVAYTTWLPPGTGRVLVQRERER